MSVMTSMRGISCTLRSVRRCLIASSVSMHFIGSFGSILLRASLGLGARLWVMRSTAGTQLTPQSVLARSIARMVVTSTRPCIAMSILCVEMVCTARTQALRMEESSAICLMNVPRKDHAKMQAKTTRANSAIHTLCVPKVLHVMSLDAPTVMLYPSVSMATSVSSSLILSTLNHLPTTSTKHVSTPRINTIHRRAQN